MLVRLLLGRLVGEDPVRELLAAYAEQLAVRRAELQQVRDALGDDPEPRFPAHVADWGLRYYAFEDEMTRDLLDELEATGQ